MNIRRMLLTLLLLAAAGRALAQTDISGTWAGDLPVGPDTTLEIHFVLTRAADGSYAATLSSPDPGGIQDMPADSASFENGTLVMTVDALSGRYEGVYSDGGFTGNWQQQGTAIPLNLAPYTERELSAEAKDALRGSWVGELNVVQANVTLAIVFRFEDNASGEFVGFLDSPDQGANNIAVTNIELNDGELSFAIPQIAGEYRGTLAGEMLDGTFTQVGQALPLVMRRGEYVARGQSLAPEAVERLEGSWTGRVANAAGGSLPIVLRFEASADGGVVAMLDSPEQGASNIPVTEVAVDGDSFSFVVPAVQASFTGTLSADEISGTWGQGNMTQALTLARGEYVRTVTPLALSDEAFDRLAGVWSGEMGPLELFVRIETTADGQRVGYLDVPAQGANGLTVPEVTLEGDAVTIRITGIGATFTGTLAGDEMQGTWQQGQANNPLTLTRD